MNAPSRGTGFSFFCDDFTPAPRDPLSCELCGHLQHEHPVLANERPELKPAAASSAELEPKLQGEAWRVAMLERCDAIDRRIAVAIDRIDGIYAELRAFRSRQGVA
jgi:hypothetical protein